MPQFSSPLWMLKPRYDAVVIGTGYGGAIAASRLSRARRPDGTAVSVCVLERGNEIPTGEFPNDPKAAFKQSTLDLPPERTGADNGLYYFHVNNEITVLQGCGLGGTSLINANVALPPEKRVFEEPSWPRAIREDVDGRLEAGFEQARAMLRPVPYPDKGPLIKYEALKFAAGADATVSRVPININLEEGINAVGVHQKACSGCGDCVSGCNVGAKNSLTKNYLPDAKNHGADIFCGIAVRSIARRGDAWAVYFVPVGHHREVYNAPEMFVLASNVIVSAGSLGSTEILLRSRQRGLPCSDHLGKRFTGNGDVLGFAYNGDKRVNGIGRGPHHSPEQPGPTITGMIDHRKTDKLADAFIVEEGALPSAMQRILPGAFKLAAKATGSDTNQSFWHSLRQWGREALSIITAFAGGSYRGSMANTLTFLTMSYDDDHGYMVLEDDRVRIHWPDAAKQPVWDMVTNRFKQLATATGADYVPSPLFTKYFNFDVLTVHPLGGCVLADDALTGVVNERGNVFSHTTGSETHPGLYVMDGAVIPHPVGVNPLFTISALAERNIRLLIDDHGWKLDEAMTPGQQARFDGRRDPRPVTVQFSERMTGYLTRTSADFPAAAEEARGREHTATAIYGIMSPDLDAMIADPDRTAKLTGTLHIAALSPAPMMIFDGIFNLFVNVDERSESGGGDPTGSAGGSPHGGEKAPRVIDGKRHKRMRYRMSLSAIDGEQYYFDGFKEVQDHGGIDVYADTTELFATVRAGNKDGPVVAKGIMKINAEDVLNLIRTMAAFDRDGEASIRERARFGKLFVGDLWDVYGLKEKLARL